MQCVHVVIGFCETCIMEIFQKQSVKTFSSALPFPPIPFPEDRVGLQGLCTILSFG